MQIRKINNCKILKTTVLILLLVLVPILYNLNIVAAENTSENNKSDIVTLKTEVIPSQNGEKIRKNYFSNGGYEEICIDKNGKTKKWVSYDKSGNLLIEIIYDDYGGEVIHLPDWSIELLKEKKFYIEPSQNEPFLDEPDDVKIEFQLQQNKKEQNSDFSTLAIANPGAYYDVETKPILYRIEYVNGKEVKIYARHTI